MKSSFVPVITVSLLLSCFTVRADVVKLKDGGARFKASFWAATPARSISSIPAEGR